MLSEISTWVRESVDGITLVLVSAPTPEAPIPASQSDWVVALIGFGGALAGAIVAASITAWMQRKTTNDQIESQRQLEEQKQLHQCLAGFARLTELTYLIESIDSQIQHVTSLLRSRGIDYRTHPGMLTPMAGSFPMATPLQPENYSFLFSTPDVNLVNRINLITDKVTSAREVAVQLSHEINDLHHWLADHADLPPESDEIGVRHSINLDEAARYQARAQRVIDCMAFLENQAGEIAKASTELAKDYLEAAKKHYPGAISTVQFGSNGAREGAL